MTSMEAREIIFKFSQEAGRTCGMHYEIYRVSYSNAVRRFIETLSESDKDVFLKAAKTDCDLALCDVEFAKAEIAESEALDEIRREQE